MQDDCVSREGFGTIQAWIEAHGSTKRFVAEKLEISRFQLEGLLLTEGHQPPVAIFDVRSDLAERVALLIGQTTEYVRDFYRKVAA